MPAFHIQRSTLIDADPGRIFDTLADYGTWTTWSPWLGVDPEAKVDVSPDPRSVESTYHWQGDLVGEGVMTHRTLEKPVEIEDQLDFVKPFKSTSQVRFELTAKDSGTVVTWHMVGSLPWFLFWMKSNMETFVGMDYERGLSMLKEYIETGEVASSTTVAGVETIEPKQLVGVRDQCSMDDVGPSMKSAFARVFTELKPEGEQGGRMVSIYHPTSDLRKRVFDYTSGLIADGAGATSSTLDVCEIPAGRYLRIHHVGSYENLGNAWSGGYQFARYKKIKIAKRAGFEVYQNDPESTPSSELVTDVFLPVK